MIYEDFLFFWIALFLWLFLPSDSIFTLPFSVKFFFFLSKEFLFLGSLLILGFRIKNLQEGSQALLERAFLLFSLLLFGLDIAFFGVKIFLEQFYFSSLFGLLWFFHYYILIKLLLYQLKSEFLRFSLGIFLPYLLLVGLEDLLESLNIDFPGQFLVLLFLIFLFSPYIVIKVWPVKRFPEGSYRKWIEKFVTQEKLRIRDFLILSFFGKRLFTAGILGFLPPFRYFFCSSGLLELINREEFLGILAHESGHLKKKHGFFLFFLFFTFPILLLNVLFLLFFLLSLIFKEESFWEELLKKEDLFFYLEIALALFLLGIAVFFFRIIFAYFLRSLEREADLYALTCLGDPSPLVSAFYKIGKVTGQLYRKSWHHYGLIERIEFLFLASKKPELILAHSKRWRRRFFLWMFLNFGLLFIWSLLGLKSLEEILKFFLS